MQSCEDLTVTEEHTQMKRLLHLVIEHSKPYNLSLNKEICQ